MSMPVGRRRSGCPAVAAAAQVRVVRRRGLRLPLLLLVPLAAATLGSGEVVAGAATVTTYCTSSVGQFDDIPVDGGAYTLSPDEWNSTANLCVSNDGGTDFTVASGATPNPGSGGAPGAYPNLTYVPVGGNLPAPLSSLGDSISTWSTDVTAAAGGEYDVSYDIWLADTEAGCTVPGGTPAHELMIWINEGGGALPYPAPGSGTPEVTLQNEVYQVTFTGISSTHSIINYLLTTPVSSVYDLDLRQFVADAAGRGSDQFGNPYVPADGFLCSVSAGFEIFSGNGGQQTTSFSYQPPPGAALPSGDITSAVKGMCLNAGGSTPVPSAPAQPAEVWTCATQANAAAAGQGWTVHNDDSLQMFGLCLDETGTASGSAVRLDACTGDSSQQWLIQGSTLSNLASGLCLTDPGNSHQNGTSLDVTGCGSAAGQQWREPYDGAGVWSAFTNEVDGHCLKDAGNGTAELSTCDSATDSTERWEAQANGTIVSSAGECLDAVQGKTGGGDPGDLVQVNSCSGASTQQWVTTPAGALMNPATGKCLDDPYSSTAVGALADTYKCNGTAAQKWPSAATDM
jgi:Ricin-type beta-trefoil lectin domain